MTGVYCPNCLQITPEGHIKIIPLAIQKKLDGWTEYVCPNCGTEFLDAILVLKRGKK